MYLRIVQDILDSLAHSGFQRILFVNGHGGNTPAQTAAMEWLAHHPGVQINFHDWWRAPQTWARVQEIDPVASHASWMENFPWTRLPDVAMPAGQKPLLSQARRPLLAGDEARGFYGDGNFGGYYQRSDEEMLAIWQVAVAETRTLLEEGWR